MGNTHELDARMNFMICGNYDVILCMPAFPTQEFAYDVTILAFNIRVELLTPGCHFIKGYG